MSGGNLKPAPFGLTPLLIGRVLGAAPVATARVVHVPVLPIKLVDRPRPSRGAGVSTMNDISPAPTSEVGCDKPAEVTPLQVTWSAPAEFTTPRPAGADTLALAPDTTGTSAGDRS